MACLSRSISFRNPFFRIWPLEGAIGDAVINEEKRILENWPVLESPYTKQELYSGLLEVDDPKLGKWQLRGKLMGPEWE